MSLRRLCFIYRGNVRHRQLVTSTGMLKDHVPKGKTFPGSWSKENHPKVNSWLGDNQFLTLAIHFPASSCCELSIIAAKLSLLTILDCITDDWWTRPMCIHRLVTERCNLSELSFLIQGEYKIEVTQWPDETGFLRKWQTEPQTHYEQKININRKISLGFRKVRKLFLPLL